MAHRHITLWQHMRLLPLIISAILEFSASDSEIVLRYAFICQPIIRCVEMGIDYA
jgi:hypothetical protein